MSDQNFQVSDNVETLRNMINADIAEFNAKGGGNPVEIFSVFGSMMESFLKKLPLDVRQKFWDVFVKTMKQQVGVK